MAHVFKKTNNHEHPTVTEENTPLLHRTTMVVVFSMATKLHVEIIISNLLDFIWNRRVHQSEEQVPQRPRLSTQNTGGHASSQSQSQMIGQEPKAQFKKAMMFPATI